MRACIYLVLACLMIGGCSTSNSVAGNGSVNNRHPDLSKVNRIAVLAIPSPGFPAAKFENLVMESLSQKGYGISSRADLSRILEQQHIQARDIADKENRSAIGKILNVDSIFIVEVTDVVSSGAGANAVTTQVSVAGRLIDVQSGSLAWIKNVHTHSAGLLESIAMIPLSIFMGASDQVAAVVKKLLDDFPMRGASNALSTG